MPMTFASTRSPHGASVTFEEALLNGLAPDGGLYIPTRIPDVDPEVWRGAASLPELGASVLAHWIGDEFEGDALARLAADALGFPIPLVPVQGGPWDACHVLELFHGPTLSFKDVGARTMARAMGHFLARTDQRLTILVATSGDTGSAVADGFAGQEQIDVVLLYPRGKVSPIQEMQLVAERPGVRTLAVEGRFDDCQRLVKAAFVDPDLAGRGLSSANSINIGRLLPQMLYYMWGLVQGGLSAPLFCVPSGNLGNLTAGVMAHLSGMPASGFIAAHNANDFFPRFLRGEETAFQASVHTPSSAMDVGAPSNFERLRHLLGDATMRKMVRGAGVSNEETLASMRAVHAATGYLADPHTAVGFEAVRRYREQGGCEPVVLLSTAHPAKFVEIVEEALGEAPALPPRLAALADAPRSVEAMPADYAAFKAFLMDTVPAA